jgi:hypothetical protein
LRGIWAGPASTGCRTCCLFGRLRARIVFRVRVGVNYNDQTACSNPILMIMSE